MQLSPRPTPGTFRLYPRHELAQPERLIASVNCGHCHDPVLPHGSLCFFDQALAIEPDTFVLVDDPGQPEFAGSAVKFLRRGARGLELVSNVGRKGLTSRMTVIGTLVVAYFPATGEAPGAALDARVRELVDRAMAGETARRAQIVSDAVSRWGSSR